MCAAKSESALLLDLAFKKNKTTTMNQINTPEEKDVMQRVAFRLIVFTLTIAILIYARSVLLPLAFASLMALALMGPCRFLEKYGIGRSLAAIICLVISLILLSGVFVFITSQVLNFEKDFPLLESKFLQLFYDLQNFVQVKLHVSTAVVEEYLNPLLNNALSLAPTIIGSLVGFFSTSLFITGFTFIYALMILIYRENIAQFFNRSFTHLEGKSKFTIAANTQYVIRGYVSGLMLEALFVAALLSIGFLSIGVKYAILLAVISAIFNLVPYLGFISAAIISVIITFATNTPTTAIWVGIISIIVHLIDSNIFLPAVVGNRVKINPLATVIGVFLGSLIWGIPGMFLAVPVVAIIKVFCDEILSLQPWGILFGGRLYAPKKRLKLLDKVAPIKKTTKQ
jgi:putative permease